MSVGLGGLDMRYRTALWGVFALAITGLLMGAVTARPTLTTIVVDGDYDDWRRVLANDRQFTWDGDGTSYGSFCDGSFDRDCPVGSTGRDIYTFAWTWDDRALYLYTERVDEGNNARQYFYFLMDLDNDAELQASDRVLKVSWQANNALEVSLHGYLPLDPAGDPMADPDGWVDGHDPVGTFDPVPLWAAAQPGQSRLAIEVEVPWQALGVPPGAPIKFHVSAGNTSTSLEGVLDNCGGPDGRLGTFGYSGVSVEPDHVGAVTSPGTKAYRHRITNTGNAPDVFDLWATSTRSLGLELYEDADDDGLPGNLIARDANGDGDFSDADDLLDGLWDSDGNGLPDTGVLQGDEALPVVLRLVVPVGYTGLLDTTRLYGRSQADPRYVDHATNVTGIGLVVMVPNGMATGVPGATVRHRATVINAGDTEDLADLSVAGARGWTARLWTDPDGDGAPDVLLGEDVDGDGLWEQAPGDSDGDGLPDTGLLASQAELPVVLEVEVPPEAAVGDVETTRVVLTARTDPGRPYTARYDTAVGEAVTIEPDHLLSEFTGFLALAGDFVYFPHVLTNNQAQADCFALGATSSQGWTVRIWSDPDGDGSISDGQPLTSTCALGEVAPFGGTFPLVVEVMVPDTASLATTDTTVVTATSAADGAVSDDAVDETRVSLITLHRDPERTRSARNFATCTTAYARIGGLEPGLADVYRLDWIDSTGTILRSELVPSDGRGLGRDAFGFGAADPLGVWSVVLTDTRGGLVLDEVGLRHERDGSIVEFETNQASYADGNVLSADLTLSNDNVAAPFEVTEVVFTVTSPDGSAYLAPDGTFQPYDGTGITGWFLVDPLPATERRIEGFSVQVPDFPARGDYAIQAEWRTGCGAPIATASTAFPVVLVPPVITSPADETYTTATSLPVLGTGEVGAVLTLYRDGAVLDTMPVAPDGSWSSESGALTEGRHVFTAVQAHPGELPSRPSAAVHVIVDWTAPEAPVIETPPEGLLTGRDRVEVTGRAEPWATVSVTDQGVPAGTAVADDTGTWSLPMPVAHGDHLLVATATDRAGNVSPPSAPRAFQVDLQAPPPPTLDSPIDGALLDAQAVTASGSAEPGSTVEVVDGGLVVATATADDAGAWAVDLVLADGPHILTATATDPVGNASAPSVPVGVTVDSTPPEAPVVTAPADGDLIAVRPVHVAVRAEAGAVVVVHASDGAVIGSGTASEDGAFGFDADLADGDWTVHATATDAAGHLSPPSAPVSFRIDTTAPDAPVISAPPEGFATSQATVEVAGTAEPGALVTVTLDGSDLGTATAAGDGSWSLVLSSLTHGVHEVTASATDGAGNRSIPSAVRSFRVDLEAPAAPTIDTPVEGALSPTRSVLTAGTAEPGSTVTVMDGGVVVGTAVADASGQWSVTLDLADGSHVLTATATDAVGNTSVPTAPVGFGVDSTPPLSPAVVLPADGALLPMRPVVLKVQTEAAADVAIYAEDGALLGSGTASETGLFVLEADLADGTWTVHATATDAAGHVSSPSASVSFRVDTVAPAAPVVLAPFEGQRIGLSKVLLAGIAEPGATVSLYVDATPGPVLPVGGSGEWQVWVELADGGHVASADATDPAGHVSARSSPRAFVVDTQAPGAPMIATPEDGLLTNVADHAVTGTAEAGAEVTLFLNEAEHATVTASAEGGWDLDVTLPEGRHRLTARARDRTGHLSPFGNTVQVRVDLTPPMAPLIDSPADGAVLRDPRPVLEGTAEANSRVTAFVDGVEVGSTWADGGRFRIPVPQMLEDGEHLAYAEAADEAGNLSDRGPEVSFEVDTQPVVVPDGGTGSDGGADGGVTQPSQDARTATPSGCGCSAQEGGLDATAFAALGLLGVLGLRRRRSRAST